MELPEDTPEQVLLALRSLTGEESLFSDIRDALNIGGSKVEQVEGLKDGSLVKQLNLGANTVGRLTSKALGFNDGVIRSLLSRAKSVETHEIKCPGKLIVDLTAQGDLDNLISDQKTLSDTLSTVMKYQSELEGYGKQIETLLKSAKGAKDNAKLAEIATKLSIVRFPELKLEKKEGQNYESDLLPGNKVIGCNTENGIRYTLTGSAEAGAPAEYEMSKSDLTAFLNQMRWVNTQQKSLSEMINRYSRFVKDWSNVVKDLQEHLESTEGVSNAVRNQLISYMSLSAYQVEFYTTFLPRLIAYVNHYVAQGNELATVVLK